MGSAVGRGCVFIMMALILVISTTTTSAARDVPDPLSHSSITARFDASRKLQDDPACGLRCVPGYDEECIDFYGATTCTYCMPESGWGICYHSE